MKRLSRGEETIALHIRANKLPVPCREFRFDPSRRWRFDFAWLDHRVALEVEGGTWGVGRHTSGKGFKADCEKYVAAQLAGWMVLRVTTDHVMSGEAIKWIKQALETK